MGIDELSRQPMEIHTYRTTGNTAYRPESAQAPPYPCHVNIVMVDGQTIHRASYFHSQIGVLNTLVTRSCYMLKKYISLL